MNLEGISKKGIKLIQENPGKTVYELVQLGLSEKDASKMQQNESSPIPAIQANGPVDETNNTPTPNKILPVKVETQPVGASRLTPLPSIVANSGGPGRSVDPYKDGTWYLHKGIKKWGNRNFIEKMAKQYPQEFQIVG